MTKYTGPDFGELSEAGIFPHYSEHSGLEAKVNRYNGPAEDLYNKITGNSKPSAGMSLDLGSGPK
jgi:hypothetical protein